MPKELPGSLRISQLLNSMSTDEEFARRLSPRNIEQYPLSNALPTSGNDQASLQKRLALLRSQGIKLNAVCSGPEGIAEDFLEGNIENHIGWVQMPLGVIGPLRINGFFAHGDFFVPMATTEGALIASYNRGAKVIGLAGGASAVCLSESISRAPCFLFESIAETGVFLDWAVNNMESFKRIAATTTRHGELIGITTTWNSDYCFLTLEFVTGDAAGQNMVTIATDAVCQWIIENSPVKPRTWYLEGNMSGDKKASMLSFLGVRGKKVVTETVIPDPIIQKYLHTTAEAMAEYCRISTSGGIQSGSIGVQGHYANALAALFVACGQDVACVSEASVGITQMRVDEQGRLHVSVSLPNLTVGTVGGGTRFPTSRECLEMMDCYGKGKARKFAEIVAVTALAGEISMIAALAAGHFGSAHAKYRHKV
jgi:hydroxymethylglutaryl-CoA reductase (NADPH)